PLFLPPVFSTSPASVTVPWNPGLTALGYRISPLSGLKAIRRQWNDDVWIPMPRGRVAGREQPFRVDFAVALMNTPRATPAANPPRAHTSLPGAQLEFPSPLSPRGNWYLHILGETERHGNPRILR